MKKVISILLIITVLMGLHSFSVSAYNINNYIDVTLTEEASDLVREGKYEYTTESFPEYDLYDVTYNNKKYETYYKVRLFFTHDDYIHADEIGKKLLEREDVLYVNKMNGFSFNPELKYIRCYLTYEATCDFIEGKLSFTTKSFPDINALGVRVGRQISTGRYFLSITVGVYEDSEYNEFKEILKNRKEFDFTSYNADNSKNIYLYVDENADVDFDSKYKWNLDNDDVIDFNNGIISASKEGCAKLTREDTDGNIMIYNIYVYNKINVEEDDTSFDVNLKVGETVTFPQWDEYGYLRAWDVCGNDFDMECLSCSYADSPPVRKKANSIKGSNFGTITGIMEGEGKLFGVNLKGERVIYNITVEKCQHENTMIKYQKAKSYFEKGYTGNKLCKACGEVVEKGKSIPELKLKTPKATIKGGKKKITVKYKKVTDATGFQVKYKIGKKAVTKTYNTKKGVTKTIKNLKKGTYKVYVRAFVKQGKNKAYSSWSNEKKVNVK